MRNLILLVFLILLIGCEKKETQTQDSPVQVKDEPSESEIENEVYYLVARISYENYSYNTCMFLGQDGVYKNLAITSVKIIQREPVNNAGDGKEQLINLHLTGIADRYNVVGFGNTSFVGRTNFSVDKTFKFLKSKDKWLGYIYDNVRDRKTLKFKKDFLR